MNIKIKIGGLKLENLGKVASGYVLMAASLEMKAFQYGACNYG